MLPRLAAEDLYPLRGKILMCWCTLDIDCHADALLEAVDQLSRAESRPT